MNFDAFLPIISMLVKLIFMFLCILYRVMVRVTWGHLFLKTVSWQLSAIFGSSYRAFLDFLFLSLRAHLSLSSEGTVAGKRFQLSHLEAVLFNWIDSSEQGNEAEFCVLFLCDSEDKITNQPCFQVLILLGEHF